MSMFCYQCEQTAKGAGCTVAGVCGKSPEVAALQDVLLHVTKGIAQYAHRARQLGSTDEGIDQFTIDALFSTVTNVNFDEARLDGMITEAVAKRGQAKAMYESACAAAGKTPEALSGPAVWQPAADREGRVAQAPEVGIVAFREKWGEDIAGLRELVTYGVKGAAAYADHARILGKKDDEIAAGFHELLDLMTADDLCPTGLTAAAMKAGEINIQAMASLDEANTSTYGHPEPTQVRVTPVAGKAIAVTGHDLKDLELLLKQTEGKGINVYTHGEMLPCHAYPELKKYKHLVGNYGNAWQNQRKEFSEFPGAVLFTTNCIQKPDESYKARTFTTGLVAWPGVQHIGDDKDFSPVIEAALAADGFAEDSPEQTITIGFGRNTVMSVAGTVIDAVKAGAIKHFFLIGGCDGAKPGRNYYTELAEKVPQDSVILTLACGKYRFNKLDFGDIGGVPRLLDIGQCNDAYSAVQIALALADAFQTDVNGLPLSLILSWYEQKAVAILLSLLHLGVKDIRLGPSLPAFVTPTVLNVLVENFGIKPTTTADEDLAAILAN